MFPLFNAVTALRGEIPLWKAGRIDALVFLRERKVKSVVQVDLGVEQIFLQALTLGRSARWVGEAFLDLSKMSLGFLTLW